MIITIVSEHDRVGKSIPAINLAALGARNGRKALLIDADVRKNALQWSVRRSKAGMKLKVPVLPAYERLYATLQDHRSRYRDIVIDAGKIGSAAMKTALIVAQVAIIPVRLGERDVKLDEELIKCLETAKLFNPTLRTLIFHTRMLDRPSIQDGAAARSFAESMRCGAVAHTIIHDCRSMHDAFEHGLSVFEYHASDASATAEMERLYQEIYSGENSRSMIVAGINAVGAALGKLRPGGAVQRQR